MNRVFKAEKMLKRLEKEGRLNTLEKETIDFIWKLDGKVGNDYNYKSVVYDEPLVWLDKDDDIPEGLYVNIKDCEVE